MSDYWMVIERYMDPMEILRGLKGIEVRLCSQNLLLLIHVNLPARGIFRILNCQASEVYNVLQAHLFQAKYCIPSKHISNYLALGGDIL